MKTRITTLFIAIFLMITLTSYTLDFQNKPLYLILYWHQHQPSYLDAENGFLMGPWVRTHSTKDYYDMAAAIKDYPDIHMTVDLSSILLTQIQDYYINRIGPYVNLEENTFDTDGFLEKWRGKTDPWIDLLIKDPAHYDDEDLDYLFNKSGSQRWHCFSISRQIISRFPGYVELIPEGMNFGEISGERKPDSFTPRDYRLMIFYFYLAYFDPSFLRERLELPIKDETNNNVAIDLTDLISYSDSGTPNDDSDDAFTLKKTITAADCRRILVETYKLIASVIPIHKQLLYNPETNAGQIEVVTTPYSHPIIPLLIDSDIMKENRPSDPRPGRYSFPEDADFQIKLGIKLYEDMFGQKPYGMWPSEGSVSTDAVRMLYENGIYWAATGPHNLARSIGKDHPDNLTPEELGQIYGVPLGSGNNIAIVFRDLQISDDVAFNYNNKTAEENVGSFFNALEKYRNTGSDKDVVATVLLDGENTWEFFTKDNDASSFFNLLYKELNRRSQSGEIITVTPIEYILGNEKRGIKPHPVEEMNQITNLFPGCWFSPDFTTWIGEDEENKGWNYLLDLRNAVKENDIPLPSVNDWGVRDDDFMRAWKAVFEAEGSDWFWWYGADQTIAGGADAIFDQNFRIHILSAYRYFNQAGFALDIPFLPAIVQQDFKMFESDFEEGIILDGLLNEPAWQNNAGFFSDDDGGAQFSRNDYIKRVYYGKDKSSLFFGLTSNFPDFSALIKTGQISIELIFGESSDPVEKILYSEMNKKGTITLSGRNGMLAVHGITGKPVSNAGLRAESDQNQVEIEISNNFISDSDRFLFVIKDNAGKILDAAPDYKPLIFSSERIPQIKVTFECDASELEVPDKLYIAGSLENLGSWIPNRIAMYDDGTHGDRAAKDGIWTNEFYFEEGAEILYKFTNSGREGVWSPGEEFSVENRQIIVKDENNTGKMKVNNKFGIKE